MLYPSFIAVVMRLCHGDLHETVKYTQVFFAALWCAYVYRLAALFTDDLKAICAAYLVVSWPAFFQSHYSMFSESCYLSLMFAAYYHLFASEYLMRRVEVVKAGIFAALMLCVRPELIFILPFGFTYFGCHYLRRERNAALELGLNACAYGWFFLSLLAGYFHIRQPGSPLVMALLIPDLLCVSCATGLLLRNHGRRRLSTHLFLFSAVMLSLTLAWYAPYADQLYEWFRVGYYNSQNYNNPVAGFSENWNIIYPTWRAAFRFLFIVCAAALLLQSRFRPRRLLALVERYGQVAIAGALLCLVYAALLWTKSAGITPIRRTDPGAFTLMAGLLILTGCATGPRLRRFVNGVIVFITGAMFIYSLCAFQPVWDNPTLKDYARYMERKQRLPWQPTVYNLYPNADFNLVNATAALLHQHGLDNPKTDVRFPSFYNWPPDITLGLDLAQARIRPPFHIGLWTIYNDDWKTLNDIRKQGVTHLLVDTMPEWTNAQVKSKIGFHFYPGWDLLYKLRQGDLQGMTQLGMLQVNGRVYILYRL
jgi:hypothetical protein